MSNFRRFGALQATFAALVLLNGCSEDTAPTETSIYQGDFYWGLFSSPPVGDASDKAKVIAMGQVKFNDQTAISKSNDTMGLGNYWETQPQTLNKGPAYIGFNMVDMANGTKERHMKFNLVDRTDSKKIYMYALDADDVFVKGDVYPFVGEGWIYKDPNSNSSQHGYFYLARKQFFN